MRRRDARDFTVSRVARGRMAHLRQEAEAVSKELPGGHRIEITGFDATTGNPFRITSHDAPVEPGDPVSAAQRHVLASARALGVDSDAPEFVPDLAVQETSASDYAVHLQQCHKGIPIFQSAVTVRLDAERRIAEVVGSTIAIGRLSEELQPVTEAVKNAAEELAEAVAQAPVQKDQFNQPLPPPVAAEEVTAFQPTVIAMFSALPERPTILEGSPFVGPIQASLVWFPGDDELVLSWDISMQRPGDGTVQRSVVSGKTGEVLYAQRMTHGLTGTGNVHVENGGVPRQERPFPLPLEDYTALVPDASSQPAPRDWLDGAESAGNCTAAHVGDDGPPVQGTADGQDSVSFDPRDELGDEQKVVDIFYYACVMHDLFYLLGFREVDGNFQADNLNRGGVASDRVDAQVFPYAIPRTARFVTPPDGSPPTMLMGLVTDTGRHCAMDASVVFHEFTHGVSTRLVGGPATASGLMSPQSVAMGEGWSDFVACAMTNETTVGSWVVDQPNGLRSHPYDSSFPDAFDKVGTGRYAQSEHNIGEIWCATLMEMSRNIGMPLALQLVIDAMKLSGANPSFLNMRDSILTAAEAAAARTGLDSGAQSTLVNGIWAAFAKFGMGPAAACNGAQLTGIVADFNVPAT